MKTFVIACIAAAVIAIGAVAVLGEMQKPVETAFTTSGVRIWRACLSPLVPAKAATQSYDAALAEKPGFPLARE